MAESNQDCSCIECIIQCKKNPGWFTPDEAQAAIKTGLRSRLMLDWFEPDSRLGNKERIYILAPASIGFEGNYAPEMEDFISTIFGIWDKGRCTFLDDKNNCSLHDSGFKPNQCKHSWGCGSVDEFYKNNIEMAKLWDSEKGKLIVDNWREETWGRG